MEVQGQVLLRKIILCGVSRLNFGGPRKVSEIGSTFQMWKPHLLLMKGTLHPYHFAKERLRDNYSWMIKFQAYIPYKFDNTIIFMLVCGGEGAERAWELKCYNDRETLKMLEILRLLLWTIAGTHAYEAAYICSIVANIYDYAKRIISFVRKNVKSAD